MADREAILDFWFGHADDDAETAQDQARLWWSADAAADKTIRTRFAAQVEAAGRGDLADWAETPRGLLALVILTDQFPRNIFRKTPRAFAFDAAARAYSRQGIVRGFDRKLRPIERVFLYLPLEHSETLADQDESVRLFSELAQQALPAHQKVFTDYLRFAERHREIVARYGRFCHRNAILGRPSRPEEVEFLKQPGSSF